jgi:hypothetical protein
MIAFENELVVGERRCMDQTTIKKSSDEGVEAAAD